MPPGVLAMARSFSHNSALVVAAEHTSKSSVVTPTRNGYDRAKNRKSIFSCSRFQNLSLIHSQQTVASASPTIVVNFRPQNRSLPTAGVVVAAVVAETPFGIVK